MRYSSIDVLRTFAIFVMVLVHFGENLSGYNSPISGFGAPLFTLLSGVSYRLWVLGQTARGVSELEISKVSIRRGLFVFGLGFAFNLLVWLPKDIFNWDVLTFIGAALLLLNVARRIPLSISVLAAVLVGLTVLGCHTITEELPQRETPVTPATVPVVSVPVIVIPIEIQQAQIDRLRIYLVERRDLAAGLESFDTFLV